MMKRFTVAAVISLLWMLVIGSQLASAFSLYEELEADSGLRELEGLCHDIAIVNLLNVLYLSPQQLDDLIGIHQRRNSMVGQAKSRLARELPSSIDVFSALRHEILKGRTPEENLAEKVFRREEIIDKIIDGPGQEYGALAEETERILNDSQKVVVSYYTPCLIPPRSSINPLRVGQAGGGAAREYMKDIRSMTTDEYRSDRDDLVEEVFWDLENLIKARSGTDPDQVRTKIGRYLDWIRNLPDVEFELYDREPAEEILGKVPDEPLEETLREKVHEFLLHPRAVPFLKKLQAPR